MSRPASIRRRLLARCVFAAALALLSVVAVCWVVPQFTGMPDLFAVGPGASGKFWLDDERAGVWVQRGGWCWDSVDMRRIIFVGNARDHPFFMQNQPPDWARRISIDLREGFEEVLTVATGWPFRGMAWERWESWRPPSATPRFEFAPNGAPAGTTGADPAQVDRHARRFRLGGREWVIPMRPLWAGLLADLALAWLAWSLLLAAPLASLAALRRSRRRCVHCGYSLRGAETLAACPECGAALSARRDPSSASSRS